MYSKVTWVDKRANKIHLIQDNYVEVETVWQFRKYFFIARITCLALELNYFIFYFVKIKMRFCSYNTNKTNT